MECYFKNVVSLKEDSSFISSQLCLVKTTIGLSPKKGQYLFSEQQGTITLLLDGQTHNVTIN